MDQLAQLLIPVLVSVSVTSLVALSFHLVIRTTSGIADFAIGQYVVIGGLTGTTLVTEVRLPLVVAVCLSVVVAATVALMSDLLVFRPLEHLWGTHAGGFASVVASVALLWVWEQVTVLVFGEAAQRGPSFSETRIELGEIRATGHDLIVIAGTIMIFLLLFVALERTSMGRLLRAAGDDRRAAEYLGLNVRRARTAAFLAAGGIAGLAGVFAAPLAGMRPSGGTVFTLNGFVGLFLGGASSPWGALVGAGTLETLRIAVSRFVGSAWLDYVVLAVALLVFAFRPSGVLGRPRTRGGGERRTRRTRGEASDRQEAGAQ